MANTFTLISTTTAASSQAALELTNIPSTYTDLKLVSSTRDANNVNSYQYGSANLTINNSSSSYSARLLLGDGTQAVSGSYTTLPTWQPTLVATANTFSSTEIYLPNYAGSTNKSVSITGTTEHNGQSVYLFLLAGLWANTSAITSLKLTAEGLFATGSTMSLYGILKGSGGATVS